MLTALLLVLVSQVPARDAGKMDIGWDSSLQAYTFHDANGIHAAIKDMNVYAAQDLCAGRHVTIGGPGTERQIDTTDLADGSLLTLMVGATSTGEYFMWMKDNSEVHAAPITEFIRGLLGSADQTAALQYLGAAGGTAVPAGTNGQLLMFDENNQLISTTEALIESTNLVANNGLVLNGHVVSHDPSLKHIPAGGSAGQYLTYSAAGTAQWSNPNTSPTFQALYVTGNIVEFGTQGSVAPVFKLFAGDNTTTAGPQWQYFYPAHALSGVGSMIEAYTSADRSTFKMKFAMREVGLGQDYEFFVYDANGNKLYMKPVYDRTDSSASANVAVTLDGQLVRATSSRKYKDNIRDLKTDVDKKKVKRLRPVSYTDKGNGKRNIGLIAEEVAEVYPDLVEYDVEGKPDAIKYDRLSVILLEQVNDLQVQIDALKNDVEQLKKGK